MRVCCKICKKKIGNVKPSNVKDINNYVCRDPECRKKYLHEKYSNPDTKPKWNWSTQMKLNKMAKEIADADKKDIKLKIV